LERVPSLTTWTVAAALLGAKILFEKNRSRDIHSINPEK
jgi:hypothetical protein